MKYYSATKLGKAKKLTPPIAVYANNTRGVLSEKKISELITNTEYTTP